MAHRKCLQASLQHHLRTRQLIPYHHTDACNRLYNEIGGNDWRSEPPIATQQFRFMSSDAASNQLSMRQQFSFVSLDAVSNRASARQQFRFASSDATSTVENREKVVLYRAKWMRPLRLIVRLKIFQLGGLAAFALPLAEYANEIPAKQDVLDGSFYWRQSMDQLVIPELCCIPFLGATISFCGFDYFRTAITVATSLSVGTIAAVTAVVGGAGAASAALWYYSRRYVGEMALVGPDLRHVQLSVVDFWGNREDNKYNIRDIVPPLKGYSNAELETAANQVLIPLDVIGARQFFLSIRHGRLLQKEALLALLHGTLDLNNVHGLLASHQAPGPDTPVDSAEPLLDAGIEESSPMHQKVR